MKECQTLNGWCAQKRARKHWWNIDWNFRTWCRLQTLT